MRPTIANAYRLLIQTTLNGVFLGETHIDFSIPTFPFDDVSVTDFVTHVWAQFTGSNTDDALSDQMDLPVWTMQNFDDPTRADISVPSTAHGGESHDPLPPNVAVLVSLRTVLAGRSNRGRAYWPGYTEASADGPIFNPTSQSNLAIAYADLVSSGPGYTYPYELVVLSITNATAQPVSSVIVEPSFATMRKRLSRLRV